MTGKRPYFRDFLLFLSTIRGDLANITAPPFFLAPLSVVEVGTCWTERPSLFIAPALEADPQKRALLVLKWILASLRRQYYVGKDVNNGIKKPLNAFLGELFFGQWTDDAATSRLLSEQVSHHPPITATYMWNDDHGIRGEGYTRVEMTFSGYINIRQYGHAIVHIDRYHEDYLIPLPDVKVKGFLSGHLYPELNGVYHIISSSGFVSEITFSGKGFFSGKRNTFEAKMYKREDETKSPLYVVRGQWSDKFTIHEVKADIDIETYDPSTAQAAPIFVPETADQDPWETRRAWKNVIESIREGDMQSTLTEKSRLEEAQRAMRKKEVVDGIKWKPVFFSQLKGDYPLFDKLASAVKGWELGPERTEGVWKVDEEKLKHAAKPYHGELTPLG